MSNIHKFEPRKPTLKPKAGQTGMGQAKRNALVVFIGVAVLVAGSMLLQSMGVAG